MLSQAEKLVIRKNNTDADNDPRTTEPKLTFLLMANPISTVAVKAIYTASISAWNPRTRSLRNIAASGIMKASAFFPIYAPPNKAIAAIGVKLGQCGINLINAPATIIEARTANLEFIVVLFIFLIFFKDKVKNLYETS